MTTTFAHARVKHLSFAGIAKSEWIKLFSLRSTYISLLAVLTISPGIALLLSFPLRGEEMAPEAKTAIAATAALLLTQLLIAVQGVTVTAGEYSTGQIKTTLTSAPWRVRVLAAKTAAFAVFAFLLGLVSTGLAAIASLLVLGLDLRVVSGDLLLTIVGAAGYLTVLGVLALLLGSLVRSTAGGVALSIGLLLIAPLVLSTIPAEWVSDLLPYLPSNAAQALYALPSSEEMGDHIRSLTTLGGWLLGTCALAATVLRTRDA